MKQCPRCESTAKDSSIFCSVCGYKWQGRVCGSCGATNPERALFCMNCRSELKILRTDFSNPGFGAAPKPGISTPVQPETIKRRAKIPRFLWQAAAFCMCAVIGFGAYLVMRQGRNTSDLVEQTQQNDITENQPEESTKPAAESTASKQSAVSSTTISTETAQTVTTVTTTAGAIQTTQPTIPADGAADTDTVLTQGSETQSTQTTAKAGEAAATTATEQVTNSVTTISGVPKTSGGFVLSGIYGIKVTIRVQQPMELNGNIGFIRSTGKYDMIQWMCEEDGTGSSLKINNEQTQTEYADNGDVILTYMRSDAVYSSTDESGTILLSKLPEGAEYVQITLLNYNGDEIYYSIPVDQAVTLSADMLGYEISAW